MITVRVTGERELAAAFGFFRRGVQRLTSAWARIGAEIVDTAVPLTPVLTGRLVGNLSATVEGESAVVTSSLVYSGVQNYGWPARNITGRHFLDGALEASGGTAEREVQSDVERAARRAGLM